MRRALALLLALACGPALAQQTVTVAVSEGAVALDGTTGASVSKQYATPSAQAVALAGMSWKLSASPAVNPVLTVDQSTVAAPAAVAESQGFATPASARRKILFGSYNLNGLYGGVAKAATFQAQIGRSLDLVEDFAFANASTPGDTPATAANGWLNLENSSQSLPAAWKAAGYTNIVFSVVMIPTSSDTLSELTVNAPLSGAGTGAYDAYYRTIFTNIAASYPNAIIRLSQEFNLPYPWTAVGRTAQWIAGFQRMHDIAKSVSPGFTIVWNPAASTTPLATFDPESAYPGDAYVDAVGLDFYNYDYNPAWTTNAQRWAGYLGGGSGGFTVGFNWLAAEGALHHKPICIPEWGAGLSTSYPNGVATLSTPGGSNGGVGDDPYFVNHVAAWIVANGVAWHSYWAATGGDGWVGDPTTGAFPLTVLALRGAFGP